MSSAEGSPELTFPDIPADQLRRDLDMTFDFIEEALEDGALMVVDHYLRMVLALFEFPNIRLRAGDISFALWVQARIHVARGELREARGLAHRARKGYRPLQIRAFCMLLELDIHTLKPTGNFPEGQDVGEAMRQGDRVSAQLILAGQYRLCEGQTRRRQQAPLLETLVKLLLQLQGSLDPVALYIALQTREYLIHGPGYQPGPLSLPLPEDSRNFVAERFFEHNLKDMPEDAPESYRTDYIRLAREQLDAINREAARQHALGRSAIEAVRTSGKPLLLFLRSFSGEASGQLVSDPFLTGETQVVSPLQFSSSDRSLEDAVRAGIPDEMGAVAIENTGDFMFTQAQSGEIPRLTLPNGGWRLIFLELIERADVVLMWVADMNDGIAFELTALHELGLADKLLLIDGRSETRESLLSSPPAIFYKDFREKHLSGFAKLDELFDELVARLPDPALQVIESTELKAMLPEDIAGLLRGRAEGAHSFAGDAVDLDLYFKNLMLRPLADAGAIRRALGAGSMADR